MLLLALLACNAPDDPTEPDPRADPSGWPATVGGERPAKVVGPAATYDGESLLPVVVMLHGFGANATIQDLYLGLSGRVEARGFVLVLPEGTANTDGMQFWNATPGCCDFEGTGVDDVGYLLGLVDEVEAAFPVDPDRIGFLGHSNGGYMSYRMACEAPDRIAGIASLAGGTFLDEADCVGTEPVHVLQAHGTADADVLYAGGEYQPGAEETVRRWAVKAGCSGDPAETGTADYDGAVDGAETHQLAYDAGCEKDVSLWRMDTSGHAPIPTEAFRDAFLGFVLDHPR
jgi:polyhydroxybutyrate depolymerase